MKCRAKAVTIRHLDPNLSVPRGRVFVAGTFCWRIIMARIDFGGVVETVITRDEFPLEKAREVLGGE